MPFLRGSKDADDLKAVSTANSSNSPHSVHDNDDKDDGDSLNIMNLPTNYFYRTGGAGAEDPTPIVLDGPEGAEVDQRSLTSTSMKYDRQGKGYLDPTERALRTLDTENKGFLGIDKLYLIMDTLQQEQKRTASLIDAIHTEQKKSMNLKKGLIVLTSFAFLLAFANVGTSFAAAKLAKDMNISGENDLMSISTGERVSTTSKIPSFTLDVVDYNQTDFSLRSRRNLAERLMQEFCQSNENNNVRCVFGGSINHKAAKQMYQAFCPGWPKTTGCSGDGVPFVHMACNGAITKVYGGPYMSGSPPSDWNSKTAYTVFPTRTQGYYSEQRFSLGQGKSRCVQDFDMMMYCPKDQTPCFVFAAYEESKCGREVVLCGDT